MKRTIIFILVLATFVTCLCGCGKKETPVVDDTQPTPEDSGNTYIANPWEPLSEDEVYSKTGFHFNLPGTDKQYFYLNDGDGLTEAKFNADEAGWTARILRCSQFTDISGMYYTWKTETEAAMNGIMGFDRVYETENGSCVGCGLWFDNARGIMYSLSYTSESGYQKDIAEMAEAVFSDNF